MALRLKTKLTKNAQKALQSGRTLTIKQANVLFFQTGHGMVEKDMFSVLTGQTMLNDRQAFATGHRVATKGYYKNFVCQTDKVKIKAFYANKASAAIDRLNSIK